MSRRRQPHRCERCARPTPKKRLQETAVGALCPRCLPHLPIRLRKEPTQRVGDEEARRGR